MKDFAIILSLNIPPTNLDRPSQERNKLWIKNAWMAQRIYASVTPEFRRKPGKVNYFLCCTSEDEDEADGHCPWSKSDKVRLTTSLFFFAKNDTESDFLERSLSLEFFLFEWLVTTLLPLFEISNVWWHSLQYAVRALEPFSTHSNSICQSSLNVHLCLAILIILLKKRKIDNMGRGQNAQT